MRDRSARPQHPSMHGHGHSTRSVRTLAALGCAAALLVPDAPRTNPRAGGHAVRVGVASETTAPSPVAEDVVEGRYDVGGHELFLRCEGSGSPTVVYMHGSIEDRKHRGAPGRQRVRAPAGARLPDLRLRPAQRRRQRYRRCGPAARGRRQRPAQAPRRRGRSSRRTSWSVRRSAGCSPTSTPTSTRTRSSAWCCWTRCSPTSCRWSTCSRRRTGTRLRPGRRAEGLERISHFKCITAGQRFIGKEPRIPVTYLASDTEGYEDNDYGIPEYDRRILEVQAAYVDRFAPGKLIRVDAPHFMEPVIPETIAEEVRGVIEAASAG